MVLLVFKLLVFLQDSKGINKKESELTACKMHTRPQGEVLCSLINIYFRECMIEVWGNLIFNSMLNLML